MFLTMGEVLRGGLLAATLLPLLAEPQAQTKGTDEKRKPAKEATSAPPTLEQLLATALKNNPDIRVAEAKMREAEAELSRVRLQVTQRVSTYRAEHDKRVRLVADAQTRLTTMQKLHMAKGLSAEELRAAEAALMRQKADLAVLEAELPYLLGQARALTGTEGTLNFTLGNSTFTPAINLRTAEFRLWDAVTGKEVDQTARWTSVAHVNQVVADRVRTGMEAIVSIDLKGEPLPEALKLLFQKSGGVPYHVTLDPDLSAREVILKLNEVPLSAVFQALEDQFPDQRALGGADGLSFVVRDYGVLATTKSLAPVGAVTLQSFLKRPEKSEKGGPAPKK